MAAAAAYATLDTLKTGNFGERVENRGDYFADKLLALDEITEVRGSGLMIGAVLKDEFKAPFVVDAALDAGFIINATDEHTLRFLPPLIIEEKDIDKFIAALPQICIDSKQKEIEAAEAAKKAEEEAAAAQEEYDRLMKEAENVNANFKEVMEMLKDKVGNAEDKLGDVLKKDAAQKKSSSDDAAEGGASEETK